MIEYYTMASFYSSLCGEGDMLPNTYLADQKLANSSKLNKETMPTDSRQHISQNHALSLSLGSQEPSLLQMHTTNYSSCNTQSDSGVELSQNDNVQYYQEQNYQGRWSLCESTYLKAAQDLLDELVNVHRAPIVKNDEEALLDYDISPASECPDLRNKHTKLFCMLDEVNRRLKQYEHEMQAVVSSLETVAGRGAALPYTFLPLQTISRHFRCLRHAIKKQIQVDNSSHAGFGVLSRLRRVDQQLRQQKALQHQQFGFIRQPWRPQRGLPETAVSALRAWLFHHFLHPYPTDSEKMLLARETGLTRSQVANWFINARVRLWKPMIEEIYKEEFGDEREEVSVSAAQHSDTDSFKHTIESRGNDASSASMIVDKVEYYYNMGPGNNHNGFSNTHLLADGR